MNISRPALTGLVIGAVLFATAVSASAEFPGSQAAAAGRGFAGGPLENWMTAIERHVPGTADAPAVTVSESAEEFRQRYLLIYSPAGVARGGWHRLEVRLKGRRRTVKARPGYHGGR